MEYQRALINRLLVANRVAAKGYDEACHQDDKRMMISQVRLNLNSMVWQKKKFLDNLMP